MGESQFSQFVTAGFYIGNTRMVQLWNKAVVDADYPNLPRNFSVEVAELLSLHQWVVRRSCKRLLRAWICAFNICWIFFLLPPNLLHGKWQIYFRRFLAKKIFHGFFPLVVIESRDHRIMQRCFFCLFAGLLLPQVLQRVHLPNKPCMYWNLKYIIKNIPPEYFVRSFSGIRWNQ